MIVLKCRAQTSESCVMSAIWLTTTVRVKRAACIRAQQCVIIRFPYYGMAANYVNLNQRYRMYVTYTIGSTVCTGAQWLLSTDVILYG